MSGMRVPRMNDGHVVDLDRAFGEQFFDVSVGQAVAEVPAHRHHDHLGRKAEPGERRPRRSTATRTRHGLHWSTMPDPPIS
jgi:hypothetical protein